MNEKFIEIESINKNKVFIKRESINAIFEDGYKTLIFVIGDSIPFKTYEDIESLMKRIW